jgi:hypothetical protein
MQYNIGPNGKIGEWRGNPAARIREEEMLAFLPELQ